MKTKTTRGKIPGRRKRGNPEEHFEFVLHLVSRSLLRLYNEHFRSLGLTSNEAGILLQLGWADLYTQTELATALGIGKAAAGALIVDLETRGYLKRQRSAEDARRIEVTLTRDGSAMVDEINDRMTRLESHVRAGISQKELDRTTANLLKLHQNVLTTGAVMNDPSANENGREE